MPLKGKEQLELRPGLKLPLQAMHKPLLSGIFTQPTYVHLYHAVVILGNCFHFSSGINLREMVLKDTIGVRNAVKAVHSRHL